MTPDPAFKHMLVKCNDVTLKSRNKKPRNGGFMKCAEIISLLVDKLLSG